MGLSILYGARQAQKVVLVQEINAKSLQYLTIFHCAFPLKMSIAMIVASLENIEYLVDLLETSNSVF